MVEAESSFDRYRRWWPFALLPALQWALSFTLARTISTVGTYDTAYYYVIARNWAVGRGLTDTVLWQFLGAPDAVQRPAGSYWEVGWPLVLGSLMRLFGHSQRAAILITAGLSGLLPVATAWVAYLVCRQRGPAWVAGLLVCLQARLVASDITPDITLSYQLACLAGIGAFLWLRERDLSPVRLLACGAVIALPMHLRGEGFIVGAAVLPLVLFAGGRARRDNLQRTVWIATGIALAGLPFAIRNWLVFGHLIPEAQSLRLWMTDYTDLYRFPSDPTPATFWAQGAAKILGLRQHALIEHLRLLARQLPWPLLVLAAAGAITWVRSARARVVPLFFALSLVVPCLIAPVIANEGRFVMDSLPVLCVAASLGIFSVSDVVARKVSLPGLAATISAVMTCAAVVLYRPAASIQSYLDGLQEYRATHESMTDKAALEPLHLEPGDVVLTDDPWRVAAVLDVATMSLPAGDPGPAIAKYRPRFFVASSSRHVERVRLSRQPALRPVATIRDRTWYELEGPARAADGRWAEDGR